LIVTTVQPSLHRNIAIVLLGTIRGEDRRAKGWGATKKGNGIMEVAYYSKDDKKAAWWAKRINSGGN